MNLFLFFSLYKQTFNNFKLLNLPISLFFINFKNICINHFPNRISLLKYFTNFILFLKLVLYYFKIQIFMPDSVK